MLVTSHRRDFVKMATFPLTSKWVIILDIFPQIRALDVSPRARPDWNLEHSVSNCFPSSRSCFFFISLSFRFFFSFLFLCVFSFHVSFFSFFFLFHFLFVFFLVFSLSSCLFLSSFFSFLFSFSFFISFFLREIRHGPYIYSSTQLSERTKLVERLKEEPPCRFSIDSAMSFSLRERTSIRNSPCRVGNHQSGRFCRFFFVFCFIFFLPTVVGALENAVCSTDTRAGRWINLLSNSNRESPLAPFCAFQTLFQLIPSKCFRFICYERHLVR